MNEKENQLHFQSVTTEPFLTLPELAAELKVPESWLYARTRLRGKDTIPRIKIGKYLRFQLPAVLRWIQSQQPETN